MPVALEARKARFAYVLKSDRDKPAEQRPTFMLRQLNLRRCKAVAAAFDATPADGASYVDSRCASLASHVTGWTQMRSDDPEIIQAFGLTPPPDGSAVELPFDPQKLELLLNASELQELMRALLAGGFDEQEKKTS